MAFKRLTVDEMIQISAPWVASGEPANQAFGKHPLLSAMLPHLQIAHSGVFQVRTRADNPKVWRLCEQAYDLDAAHDDLVRGIYAALTLLSQTSEPAEEYLRLRDFLLPEGLTHATKTYREEHGHAVLVAARMDSAVSACLKAITFNERNLFELVEAWIQTAKKLGHVEEERSQLSPTSSTLASEINMARLRWIRVVNTLVSAALMVNLDAQTDALLFSSLRQLERHAEARGGLREKSASSANLPTMRPPTVLADSEI